MKIDNQFKRELEIVLDEQFPKIYIEGEEKRLMKRGDALMLFSAANIIHSRLQQEYGKECEEKGRNEVCNYIEEWRVFWNEWKEIKAKHREPDFVIKPDFFDFMQWLSARHSSNKV